MTVTLSALQLRLRANPLWLTGTFRLNPERSESPSVVAERATSHLPSGERESVYYRLLEKLDAPQEMAIERRGTTVEIASTRAPRTTFEADGRERTEQLSNGVTSRVFASLQRDRLKVRSTGFRESDFQVTFEPVEQGRRLRVTSRVYVERLDQPVVVVNEYDKVADLARLDIYELADRSSNASATSPRGDFLIRNGETLVAVLDDSLSTETVRIGDRVRLTVRQPGEYFGAVIEGHITNANRSGPMTGRSEMSFTFDTIRLRDDRSYWFAGFVESVRTPSGEIVSADNEGTVRDQRGVNVQRAAIGTAAGPIIGAIASGQKGAAVGAIIGGGSSAGSVYVRGRKDLELLRGTELIIRASSPK